MTLNIFLKFPLKHPNKASTIATKKTTRNTEQRSKPTLTVSEKAIEYRANGRPVLKKYKLVCDNHLGLGWGSINAIYTLPYCHGENVQSVDESEDKVSKTEFGCMSQNDIARSGHNWAKKYKPSNGSW